MQKSPKTPRMQNSYCVNYDRLVSMTRFAATVRAGGTCAAITFHGQREDHRVCAGGSECLRSPRAHHAIASESPWPETRTSTSLREGSTSPLHVGCRNRGISQVFADQSSQEWFEHNVTGSQPQRRRRRTT